MGLLLACLLGHRGFRVLVVDQRHAPPAHSQAIGITPPSLQILAGLGLDTVFMAHGIQMRDCQVHGHFGHLGRATFRHLPNPYRCILSLPQQVTMELLSAKLTEFPNVTLRLNTEISALDQSPGSVILSGQSAGFSFSATAAWLVGCDGHRSRVRSLIHMRTSGGSYRCHFVMGDFIDRTALGSEAHLFFTADGAVESFPLPFGLRRWIVQTPSAMPHAAAGYISSVVRRRIAFELPAADQVSQSQFTPRWLSCEQYHDGRVLLCGDAAHLMSPIGGQGMNTGWADAEFIAGMLDAIEHHGQPAGPLLRAYDRCRRKAARVATRRAAVGMWLGTRTGLLASVARDLFLAGCVLSGPLASHIGPRFAMLTIPCNRLPNVPNSL